MFYRCQKVQLKTNTRLKRVQKERSKGNQSALWSGAPDCPVCHRTVSGAGRIDLKLFTFGFPRRTSAIIHRTVRWHTGLSGVPAEQRLPVRNGRLWQEQCRTVNATEVSAVGQKGHRTVRCAPDCPVPHEDKASYGRPAPSPNGRMTWRRTGLSGAPVASRLHQRLDFGWWL
jgi:hypothetical protein